MSFHVKDDFSPGRPVSQVPASWFNAIGRFVNTLVGGFGIGAAKSDSGKTVIGLKRDVLQQEIENATQNLRISKDAGTPEDATDEPIGVIDQNGAEVSWTAGGAGGLKLECYCLLAPQVAGSSYSTFQRCVLTFSKDGLLVSGHLLPDRIRIQAKNA